MKAGYGRGKGVPMKGGVGGRTIRLRWPGTCRQCGATLAAGTAVLWDSDAKAATCLACTHAEIAIVPNRRGKAGASARLEHQRRAQPEVRARQAAVDADVAWRKQVQAERPIVGRLLTALKPRPAVGVEPAHTRAWAVGAEGEEAVGRLLDSHPDAYALHDRRIPGSRANVDHIALGPAAVYVIDAKRYQGAVEQRGDRLFVAGRDRSKLLDGVRWQVERVRAALHGEDVPVHGVACFVGATWPRLWARPLHFEGVAALWPDRLVELVGTPGPMGVARTMALVHRLTAAFPRAVGPQASGGTAAGRVVNANVQPSFVSPSMTNRQV